MLAALVLGLAAVRLKVPPSGETVRLVNRLQFLPAGIFAENATG
jgi:hypothetical protein